MDVTQFLDQNVNTQVQLPIVLLCGNVTDIPVGALTFASLERLGQLTVRIDRNVCFMVSDESCDIISVVREFPSLFDFQFVVVTGVPNCDYTSAFEQAAYRFAKVSFHDVIIGIQEAEKVAALVNEESKGSSIYQTEQSRITRKGGNIRQIGAFDAPSMSIQDVDADAVEDDEGEK